MQRKSRRQLERCTSGYIQHKFYNLHSPNAAKECLTEVHCGNNRYFVNCIYDRFQEACLLSDSDEMKGKVVKVMTWLN